MTIGIEHAILIITTLAGVITTYLESRKAKAEAAKAKAEALKAQLEAERAGEAEGLLKVAVEGVEEIKKENPEIGRQVVDKIHKRTKLFGIDSKFNDVVQEIVRGQGNVSDVTRKFSKTKLRESLSEDDIA